MERRSEVRVETNEPVVVTELGVQRNNPVGGMILDKSGSGMLLKVPHFLKVDALIKIEASNMLLLGEVARCEPHQQGFYLGVLIRHSLQNLQGLQNLNRALLEAEDRLPEAEDKLCEEGVPVTVSRREGTAGPNS